MNLTKSTKPGLTSAEVSNLWNSYLFESMVHHIFIYFSKNLEDMEIKAHVEADITFSRKHIERYTTILKADDLPIPRGTISEDINENASRLFSDKLCITYIKNLAKFALSTATIAYTEAVHSEVKELFRDYSVRLTSVEQDVTDIMMAKNIMPIAPVVHIPNLVEFIEGESFFKGYFGDRRPLSVTEIKLLYNNVHSNMLGKALLMGFIQVVKDKEIKEYFIKGKEIAEKLIKSYSEKLLADGIELPSEMDSEVLDFSGSDSPFADRLMLNHIVLLNAYGIGNYGMAMAQSQRNDLNIMYGKDIVEIGLYAKNGAEILVDRKWLEQPPILRK